MRKIISILSLVAIASLLLVACGGAAPAPSGETVTVKETVVVTVEVTSAPAAPPVVAPAGYGVTLETVKTRGNLICGVNSQVPGFGYVAADGSFSGFDVDYCRAVAAAIFGDPAKVEFRAVTATERFTALQSGEIDILSRNTTWSLARDTELGGNFVHTTFYDGQGMMVPSDSGISTLQDLEGGTICVQTGTTTELNLADVMASLGVSYTPAVFEDADSTMGAYSEGRCDAVTTDKSGLISRRTVLADPSAHVILDATMSKEPLGPMVRHGDDQWFDIVRTVMWALISAEEFGITSSNVEEMKASENGDIRILLGAEGDWGNTQLGVDADSLARAIAAVGNYGEIYDRYFGAGGIAFELDRGLNRLARDGGLLYSPPIK